MKAIDQIVQGSGQPNVNLLEKLVGLDGKSWMLSTTMAGVLLATSILPLLNGSSAGYSTLIGLNTAILIVLGVLLSYVNTTQKNTTRIWISVVLTALMISISAYFLLEAWLEEHWLLSSILANDESFEPLTEFNIQIYVFFVLLGIITCMEGFAGKPQWHVMDVLTLFLAFSLLLLFFGFCLQFISGNVNGLEIFRSSCMLIAASSLFYSSLIKRIQAGIFSIFVSIGIGSDVARKVLPSLVLLPLIIVGSCLAGERLGALTLTQVATITAAATACVLIFLSIRIANHVNTLEKNLLDMSLIDDLTGIYNRRGFYLLGEHILKEGKRSGEPVMVLFFDLDGLKDVNDTLGHEMGSDLISDFASILRANFRNCDVVARVGGDEFGVVTQQDAYKIVLNRLKNSIESANRLNQKSYKIRYSVGVASTGKTRGDEKFSDLVSEADTLMYARKKQKRVLSPDVINTGIPLPH